jgi:hypothetical protein
MLNITFRFNRSGRGRRLFNFIFLRKAGNHTLLWEISQFSIDVSNLEEVLECDK